MRTENEEYVILQDQNELELKIEIEDIDIKSTFLSKELDLSGLKDQPVISFECKQKEMHQNNNLTREILFTEIETNKHTLGPMEKPNFIETLNDIKVEQLEEQCHNVNQPLKELSVMLFRQHLEETKLILSERYVAVLGTYIFILFKFKNSFTQGFNICFEVLIVF